MPNQYKLKNCPTCGTEHRKKGLYCSRSCGNSREYTEEQKKQRRIVTRDYYNTPEGIATTKKISAIRTGEISKGLSEEEWTVSIPDINDLRDYDQFLVNYDRGEKW